MMSTVRLAVAVLVVLGTTAITHAESISAKDIREATRAIDDEKLVNADANTANWITHGRTYAEQRFSPLDGIDADNVAQLQEVWTFDTGTRRGLEATPIVVDGVMYVTGSWSKVYALDARTGNQIWAFDPKVPQLRGRWSCCDVVNRGVAVYEGKVFAGTLDGRLIALAADTGKVVWDVVTVDQSKPYTITGAPRVVKGNVLIGNGGAEFGVRGYVSAYDAATGKLAWRTYTVPGDPSKPFESKAMEEAAKTWTGEWWTMGGGGTVWDSMAYDPELELVYIGVGNGSPWNQSLRSPKGGDNLFLASIVALKPDTGEIVWWYQTTPGETWDFTATQHIILADLEIDGKKRKVLMQAPKNGFFYVIDRTNGKFISAEKYVEVTWAERVDPETGRPVEAEGAREFENLKIQKPGALGGHNWHPMAFHPGTGLVYLPAQEIFAGYRSDPDFEFKDGKWNAGFDMEAFAGFEVELTKGHLLAWDPVKQKEAWRVEHKIGWNGGVLATAGNLVFQGNAEGNFVAYHADTGEKLWEAPAGSGIIAAPATWELDGRQHVTVLAGWGGAHALLGGKPAEAIGVGATPAGKVITYALPVTATEKKPADPKILEGKSLYHEWCARCHGSDAISGVIVPDLRKSTFLASDQFEKVILEGLPGTGMPPMKDWLEPAEARLIRDYVRARAAGQSP